jgi:hypothetical protein
MSPLRNRLVNVLTHPQNKRPLSEFFVNEGKQSEELPQDAKAAIAEEEVEVPEGVDLSRFLPRPGSGKLVNPRNAAVAVRQQVSVLGNESYPTTNGCPHE